MPIYGYAHEGDDVLVSTAADTALLDQSRNGDASEEYLLGYCGDAWTTLGTVWLDGNAGADTTDTTGTCNDLQVTGGGGDDDTCGHSSCGCTSTFGPRAPPSDR